MKFERSEIGALFSKLRTAVPEVRAVGNDSTGILLSGPDAFATNLELSIRAELSSPVPQGVVIPPRGVDFISGAVAPEININVTKSGLVIESGTALAYALCVASSREDRWQEAHPPKSGKGRKDA